MMLLQPIALKEWAAAVKALNEGDQVMIMRKGGIAEETKEFQLNSQSFFLFPTYEHQKKELLKDRFQGYVDETLKAWNPQRSTVSLTCYAEVVEDIHVRDQFRLEKLYPYHIWTERFAEERLRWKRTHPLHVLLLRVFRLNQPIEIPVLPAYRGCKSWLRIETALPETGMRQVLEESRLQAMFREIRESLE